MRNTNIILAAALAVRSFAWTGSTFAQAIHSTDNTPSAADNGAVRTDANGTITYSPISTTTVAAAIARIGIHPNPATGGRFYLSTTDADEIVVNVYTSTGQLLLHTALQGQTEYPIQLPTQTLSLSTVFVQVVSHNSTQTFTVLVHP